MMGKLTSNKRKGILVRVKEAPLRFEEMQLSDEKGKGGTYER